MPGAGQTTRTIDAGEMHTAALRLVVSPFTTLWLMTAGAVGGAPDVPEALRRRILARLRERDLEALRPIVPGASGQLPDFAMGTVEPGVYTLEDELDRIAEWPADAAAQQIAMLAEGDADRVWRRPARDTAAWTHAYVAAMARAWPVVEPVWRAASPRVTREVERAALAAGLGAQTEMLTSIWPGSRADESGLHFSVSAGRWPERVRLADRTLVLVPMLSARRRRLIGGVVDDRPRRLRDLTYAISLGAPEPAGATEARAALDALVGTPRATILRALPRPRDMSSVADALQSVPSSASRHVAGLEAAGLVERRRAGRRVLVGRTERGHRLVELY